MSSSLSPFAKLARLDWIFLLVVLGLCAFSVAVIYSATYTAESAEFRNAHISQIYWIALGLVGFFTMALIDYSLLVRLSIPIFGVLIFLLILVLVIGQEVNGAKSWIRFGGIGIQPAELCKISFILLLTLVLTENESHIRKLGFVAAVGALTLVPVALILKQPDLGSAGVFFPITFAMMLTAGVRKRYIGVVVLGILAGILFSYWVVYRAEWEGTAKDLAPSVGRSFVIAFRGDPQPATPVKRNASVNSTEQTGEKKKYLLKPYQLNRIKTFYDPNLDPQNAGWTINQSLIAIGSGGLQGKGWLQGTQNVLGFLPKNIAYNDFIFSVVCEEWGFIGGAVVISALAFLLLCCVRVAWYARDQAGTFLCIGIAAMLFTHVFINIGMTIKVVPITGIPLPFISYGGTFIVVCLAAMGMVQSVWIHRRINSTGGIAARI